MCKNRSLSLLLTGLLVVARAHPLLAQELCQDFETRFIYSGKTKSESVSACAIESPQGLLFTSPSCMTSDTCQMRKTLQSTTIPQNQIFKSIGSPHFHVCHIMGWNPKIIEVKWKERWQKISICRDPSSDEFFDATTLLKIVLKK
jgi:hypothetical protein